MKAQREARLVAASRGDEAFLQRDAAQYEEWWRQREAILYRMQAAGRGLPQPTVLDGVILDREQQKEQAKCWQREWWRQREKAQRVARFAD